MIGQGADTETEAVAHTVGRLCDRIERLFNRVPNGWPQRDCAHSSPMILAPFHHKAITLRLVRLPASCLAKSLSALGHGCASESGQHLMLKTAARMWMRGEGAEDTINEAHWSGYRVDAHSPSRGWLVECGHTPIRKLVDAIESEDVKRFTLLPFRRFDYGYRPTPGLLAVDIVWDADAVHHVRVELEEARAKRRAETLPHFQAMGRAIFGSHTEEA